MSTPSRKINGASPLSSPTTSPVSVSTAILTGAIVAGASVLFLMGFIAFCIFRKKKATKINLHSHQHSLQPKRSLLANFVSSALIDNPLPSPPSVITGEEAGSSPHSDEILLPPLFSLEELSTATDGFSHEAFLGQGAFGCVHKGTLPDGTEVAVKQLEVVGALGDSEFLTEVEILCRARHRNVASLLGCCVAGGRRMLVYEFVPNNTLEYHLHGNGRPTLAFFIRYKIAYGVRNGLAHLSRLKIIHGDLKSSNILLDYNLEPKLTDFGLPKLIPGIHLSTRLMNGTIGHLAPEYTYDGELFWNSDIFSLGVLFLEFICGRSPVNFSYPDEDYSLVNWGKPLLLRFVLEYKYEELVDPELQNDYRLKEMTNMIEFASACILPPRLGRPFLYHFGFWYLPW